MESRDKFYFWYLVIHVPITVLIDQGIVIPESYQTFISKFLIQLHLSQNKDFLAKNPPLWLRLFVFFELFVQLPFFVAGAYCLRRLCKRIYPFMVIYGFNACFTTLVCLVYVFNRYEIYGLSQFEALKLGALYFPYFLIPLVMMCDFTMRIINIIPQQEEKQKSA
ncbi:uncharacterized protein PRCAT00001761001 [Priceomyces carsonii]|uniref:uncharacterized protein n=1 Tax=Priceomyces carsonii TaxID=28549 RepID=UPI002EDAE74C|nr:unnamed protein product [Priceomyces carsonii]